MPPTVTTDYSYVILGKAESLSVYTPNESGGVARSTHYYDQNGDGKLDGYKVYEGEEVVTYIHGNGAERYAEAFQKDRAAAIAKYLGAARSAAESPQGKGSHQCIGFDRMQSVRFEAEGLQFGIWLDSDGKTSRVTSFRVDRAVDGGLAMINQPIFISPNYASPGGTPPVSAPEAFQSAAEIYRKLCE